MLIGSSCLDSSFIISRQQQAEKKRLVDLSSVGETRLVSLESKKIESKESKESKELKELKKIGEELGFDSANTAKILASLERSSKFPLCNSAVSVDKHCYDLNGLNVFEFLCLSKMDNVTFFVIPNSDERGIDRRLATIYDSCGHQNIIFQDNTEKKLVSLKDSIHSLVQRNSLDYFFLVEDQAVNIRLVNFFINKTFPNIDCIVAKSFLEFKHEIKNIAKIAEFTALNLCLILDMNFPID
tara:strand:- start:2055 stop:2777 length:723 start_codon:yes stop_codon:yes gene_type:complete